MDLHSGLLSAHQSLGDIVELRLEALRTHREQSYFSGTSATYFHYVPETTTSLVSPSFEVSLPRDWTLSVGGTWSKDDTDNKSLRATGVPTSGVSYFNESRLYDANAEGPLFALGGGDARLAVGAGYRTNDYLVLDSTTRIVNVEGDDSSRFVYAELNLPLIGPDSNVAGAHQLALTAAVRGEDYDSFGKVTTPKLGVVYGPGNDFTLKASWGKSFKVPTLLQQNSTQQAYLLPMSFVGGTGYAADATLLMTYGGNSNLDPERARTWTASLNFHPESLPGLEAELTWFDIDYTDRVVIPVVTVTQALSNPIYAEFVDYSPTAEQQAGILASASQFSSFTSAAYDPSKVVAILFNQYLNATSQQVRGLDLSGSYGFDFGHGRLTIRGSASRLDSSQQTTSAQRAYDLSGTLFNPARLNGRLGAVWSRAGLTVSTFANYTGGVTDTVAAEKNASFTTFDATLRYANAGRGSVWSGLEFSLSAQNVFNRAPPLYVNASIFNVPYDSTNYSAIGRFLSVSISKHW